MTEKIIFAGHFNLGEKLEQHHQASIDDALTEITASRGRFDLGILVGDIGFAQRVLIYVPAEQETTKRINGKLISSIVTKKMATRLAGFWTGLPLRASLYRGTPLYFNAE